MKTTIKVLGIVSIVIGGLALLSLGTSEEPGYLLLGCAMFITLGILNLCSLKRIS
jgi:uncharacterized membrane protein HdeD (DUF308 family)